MSFFYVNLWHFFVGVFTYFSFRAGISSFCKVSKLSKTFIKKHRKGAKNYWLYTELHQYHNLGSFYWLNQVFLVALGIFAVVLPLSWMEWTRWPVFVCAVTLGLVEIPALFKAMISSNMETIGQSFAIFKTYKGYNGQSRHFVTVFDWLFCILPLGSYLLLVFY